MLLHVLPGRRVKALESRAMGGTQPSSSSTESEISFLSGTVSKQGQV